MDPVQKTLNTLLHVEDLLMNEVDEEHFDMNYWGHLLSGPAPKGRTSKLPACRTAACVGGYLASVTPTLALLWCGSHYVRIVRRDRGENFGDVYKLLNQEALPAERNEVFDLTRSGADHRTPKAAARACLRLAKAIADRNGYEIY